MKAKKRTAVGVVEDQVRAMTFPFMSVVRNESDDKMKFIENHSSIRLFGTVREKEMKGIIDAAARSVASIDITGNDIYTDPKNVYTSKEVKQFHDLFNGNDTCMNDTSDNSVDGGMWDVSCGTKKITSCYGH